MKILLSFLTTLLFVVAVNAQETEVISDYDVDGLLNDKYEAIAKSGSDTTEPIRHGLYESWNHGKPFISAHYKNGLLEGLFKAWYENGNPRQVSNYKGDIFHGYYIDYYTNGNVAMEGDYNRGKKVGTWIGYNENGEVLVERNYDDE